MSNQIAVYNPDVVELVNLFYAPLSTDVFSTLVNEFVHKKDKITKISDFMASGDVSAYLSYFSDGNLSRNSRIGGGELASFFSYKGAMNELTATYWNKALRGSGIYKELPQERKDEWWRITNIWREKKDLLPEETMPEFNADNLRSTIEYLVSMRVHFLSERIDGIFKNLSRTHVTNQPEGFAKRHIINNVFDQFGYVDYTKRGYIHDLRIVVAKLLRRDDVSEDQTSNILKYARSKTGEWISVDGGALRIKAFLKGTVHFEINQEISAQLNEILSVLYPSCIPDKFRNYKEKATKKEKTYTKSLYNKMLSNEMCDFLHSLDKGFIIQDSPSGLFGRERVYIPNSVCLITTRYSNKSKHFIKEATDILEYIGGVYNPDLKLYQFEYNPLPTLLEIGSTGFIPDDKSYQYYPTPDEVAQRLVDFMDIQDGESCLEPSAGQGSIAVKLKNPTCVEISDLHCKILKAKGINDVIHGDFLTLDLPKFDVIAMNPPFSEGRWQMHIKKALTLLKTGGRLGSILPISVKSNLNLFNGYKLEFSEVIENAFDKTSISVVLVKATKF